MRKLGLRTPNVVSSYFIRGGGGGSMVRFFGYGLQYNIVYVMHYQHQDHWHIDDIA